MKRMIALAFFLTYILFNLQAKADICQQVYVWEFADENKQRTNITRLLTNEVEDALTGAACTVLQRRNYARLSEQVDSEAAIQSLENVAKPINQALKLAKAKVVLFGQVSQDFSGNLFVRVSFEDLENKQILLSSALTLVGEEAYNVGKRKKKIEAFIMSCVGPKVVSNDETFFWNQTKQLNTAEGYQNYLNKYPNGKYKSEALAIQEDEAEWQEIISQKRTGKRTRLLKKYVEKKRPQHAEEAEQMLGDILWERYPPDYFKHFPDGERATEDNYWKYMSLTDYLSKYPNGKYATEEDVWKRGYVHIYLAHYPNGKYATEDNVWKNGNADLYLKHYPNGKYLAKVEQVYWKRVLKGEEALSPSDERIGEYLAHFPKYAHKVENLLWGQVQSANPNNSFELKETAQRYLKHFPTGKHAKEAKESMKF